jgi:hypothetical protein
MPGDAVDHATAGNFAVLSRQMLPNGNLRPCRIARLGQPVVAEVRGQTPPTFVWHVEQAAVMDFPQSASMDSFALSLAQYQFQTAQNLCGTCRDYHALWPYRRLAGMDIGIEASAQRVAAALPRRCRGGRILIAGAADNTLFQFAREAVRGLDPEIWVAGRCATPLAVQSCTAFRWRPGAQSSSRCRGQIAALEG